MATKKKTDKPAAKKAAKSKPEKPPQIKGAGYGGARKGAGRPAFVPTDEERKQVEAMAGYGIPIDQIAVLIRQGIDRDTVMKHFNYELKAGKAKASLKVSQTLFQKCTVMQDTGALVWWTKSQMGWKEHQAPAVVIETSRVMVVKDHGTDDDWEKKLRANQERLRSAAKH